MDNYCKSEKLVDLEKYASILDLNVSVLKDKNIGDTLFFRYHVEFKDGRPPDTSDVFNTTDACIDHFLKRSAYLAFNKKNTPFIIAKLSELFVEYGNTKRVELIKLKHHIVFSWMVVPLDIKLSEFVFHMMPDHVNVTYFTTLRLLSKHDQNLLIRMLTKEVSFIMYESLPLEDLPIKTALFNYFNI